MWTKIGRRTFLVMLLVFLPALSVTAAEYGGGTGAPNDPYSICTAGHLIRLGETPDDYDKQFILTTDIDLDPNLPGRRVFDRAVIAFDANDGERGFQGTAFAGVFDGNDHTISHLTITGEGYLGLFGHLGPGARVNDLGLVEISVVGSGGYVGGLVGCNSGHLTRCWCTGKDLGVIMTAVADGANNVGGLVGYNRGYVTGCYCTRGVNGHASVGGLVGCNAEAGTVINGHARGHVAAVWMAGGLIGRNAGTAEACCSTGGAQGGTYVGGLVGDNSGLIADCYAHGCALHGGDVYFSPSCFGGLVGTNSGTIADCYSTAAVGIGGAIMYPPIPFEMGAAVTVQDGEPEWPGVDPGTVVNSNFTGGLSRSAYCGPHVRGDNRQGADNGAYSVGRVQGIEKWESRGGLVGGSSGRVIQSFWDVQASGSSESDGGVGLTTAEMQSASTFLAAGWDFIGETENGTEDIWWILEGQDYPRLWWERPTDDSVVLVVDDFERYDDEEGNRVFDVWVDGYNIPENSSFVGCEWPGDWECPGIAHRGSQSMPMRYDNSGPAYYSEAARTWVMPQDWTANNANTLELYVRGETRSEPDRLYVAIEDSDGRIAVVPYPDPNMMLVEEWIEWNIPLTDFTDVNAAAVTKMYIGVGDRTGDSPGGVGRIYVDDIYITKASTSPEPDFVVVDDFGSYDDDNNPIYETWIDGYNVPENGAMVGCLWPLWPCFEIAYTGTQSMRLHYENAGSAYHSEAARTWVTPQNWTIYGVDTLTLYVQGWAGNEPDSLYVALEDSDAQSAVIVNPNPNAVLVEQWVEWNIPLRDFTGVDCTAITRMYIGVGDHDEPQPSRAGLIYIDDIWLTKRMP